MDRKKITVKLNKEVKRSLKILLEKKVILYPTDTVWGLGCDATDEEAVAKIYKIKQRAESKSLIILVDSITMLKKYVSEVPEKALVILKETARPTTIIYNNPKELALNVVAKDNTVAIRIVQNDFCKKLIKKFGKPIVSTSANISGNPTPKSFQEIDQAILDAVDYIVDLHQEKISNSPSRILKIASNGYLEVLRD